MAEKFSFLVLGGSGKIIKQIHCSHYVIYGLCAVLIFLVTLIGFGVADYIRLYGKNTDKEALKAEFEIQSREVVHQRKQIQRFAKEINQIKVRIVELSQTEERIRKIADLEGNSSLIGIGGSPPDGLHDDLNTDLVLSRTHSPLIKQMHRQVGRLEETIVHHQQTLADLLQVLQERQNILAFTPTIQPAEGRITSRFGYRESPFTGKREFHYGLDIANRRNTEIVAAANGRISFVGEKRGFGKILVIDHGHGITTRYAHLEQITGKRGETVERGNPIGTMGNSGRSTGPHVHYEVRLNGIPVNPQKYLMD